jgi:hypothetical protein
MCTILTMRLVAASADLLAGLAGADVTIESRYEVEAPGALGAFATSGSVISRVAGDKARSDSTVQTKSKMLGMSGGGRTADITRLDRELVWGLDIKQETYTETTFAEVRALMAEGLRQMEPAPQSAARRGRRLRHVADPLGTMQATVTSPT